MGSGEVGEFLPQGVLIGGAYINLPIYNPGEPDVPPKHNVAQGLMTTMLAPVVALWGSVGVGV